MSWFGGGGAEVSGLKKQVEELQREREELRQRCSNFKSQLDIMAATPTAAAGPTVAAPQSQPGEELIHFIETAQICLFGVNLEGTVNAWNSRVEELMGKKSKDVMGKTLYDVLSDSNETPVETRTEVSEP